MKEWRSEINKNANGGTEILMDRLVAEFGGDLDKFQIIPSRVQELDPTKIRILWLHDLGEDPMNQHLANEGWRKFHKLVFVSHTQREDYLLRYGIPHSHTTVLHNSIVPIEADVSAKAETAKERIEVVYHTTPHRGLVILVPVFKKLAETYKNIHLHVYSSFGVYGWHQRDEPFKELFEEIKNDPNMTYYGSVSNDEVRESLKTKHIFAYPSIWKETSSLCLMEAMSSGCIAVHSSLGALPETASNWTMMYDFDEDMNRHANKFYGMMEHSINIINNGFPVSEINSQKSYMDLFYSWDLRKMQWKDMLENLIIDNAGKPLDVPEDRFVWGS